MLTFALFRRFTIPVCVINLMALALMEADLQVKFSLDCVTEYVAERIRTRGHCVVVIAEGECPAHTSARFLFH